MHETQRRKIHTKFCINNGFMYNVNSNWISLHAAMVNMYNVFQNVMNVGYL